MTSIPAATRDILTEERMAQLLQELDPVARRLARVWSRDNLGAEDDLAQVARIAMWKLLEKHPDAPLPLLARQAKERIIDARKRGKSVDGRLDPVSARSHAWEVTVLDEMVEVSLTRSHPGRHDEWESPVEAIVIGKLLYQQVRLILTPQEDVYLALLLLGYRHKEAGELLGLSKTQVKYMQVLLRRKATAMLDGKVPSPEEERRRRAAQKAVRARWGLDKQPPFAVPDAVRDLLAMRDEDWS